MPCQLSEYNRFASSIFLFFISDTNSLNLLLSHVLSFESDCILFLYIPSDPTWDHISFSKLERLYSWIYAALNFFWSEEIVISCQNTENGRKEESKNQRNRYFFIEES